MSNETKAVDQNEDQEDAVEMAKQEKNPKLKEPIKLADLLAQMVNNDYSDLPTFKKNVANGRPVVSKRHTEEPLRVHKKTRPAPTTAIISTSTYFLATFCGDADTQIILLNDDIMPGKCTVEGCNCGTMGKALKEEIVDWMEKNAPDAKIVMTTEDKLSDLFYEGYTEFFADNINFEQQPQT